VPSSGLWKQSQQGLRSVASAAVSDGQEARRERPARGHGQPRAHTNEPRQQRDKLSASPARRNTATFLAARPGMLAAAAAPSLRFPASGRASRVGAPRVDPEIHERVHTMAGKLLIRLVGVLTCMAVVVTGFDAEAGWRRHHRRADCCCTAPCCEPACCEPACVSECAPCCRTYVADCCGGYTIVSRSVMVSTPTCCGGGVASTSRNAIETQTAATPTPAAEGSDSVLASRPAPTPAR